MITMNENNKLVKLCSEYKKLIKKASSTIYEYRNGEKDEAEAYHDCNERDYAKRELVDYIIDLEYRDER